MAVFTDEEMMNQISKGRPYTTFIYKSGPNRNQSGEEQARLQMAHLRHLFKLRASGKLVLNGPVTDEDGEVRGFGIFNTTDKDEIINCLDSDPAVRAGRLTYELFSWFGLPGDKLP